MDVSCVVIAKHMRKGRQEDTHEFLRYAIDGLQKSCLAGHPSFVFAFLDTNLKLIFYIANWTLKLQRRPGCTNCLVVVYVPELPVEIVGTIAIRSIAYWISVLIFSDAIRYGTHCASSLTLTT